MSDATQTRESDGGQRDSEARRHQDAAPGQQYEGENIAAGVRGYLLGLAFATVLTVASFAVLRVHFVWAPAIPIALVVFAVAQMGVHLVFFLHITTGPDNTNNVMALAFGVLIVMLLFGGSLWIMTHLNRNMTLNPAGMPMSMGR